MKSLKYGLSAIILCRACMVANAQTSAHVTLQQIVQHTSDVKDVDEFTYLRTRSYTVKPGTSERTLNGPVQEYIFDKASNTLTLNYYIAPDTTRLYRTNIYRLNSRKALTEYIAIRGKDTTERISHVLTYNKEETVAEIRVLDRKAGKSYSSSGRQTIYHYDKQGNVVEEIEYDQGKFEKRATYTYNSARKRTSETRYVSSDGFYSMRPCGNSGHTWFVPDTGFYVKTIYEYDAKQNMVLEMELNARKCVVSKTVMQYDKRGNMTRKEVFDANNALVHSLEKEYDEAGRVLVSTTYKAPHIFSGKTVCEYDRKGNKTQTVYDEHNAIIIQSRFIYDGHHKCVRVEDLYNGQLISLTEREIRYPE